MDVSWWIVAFLCNDGILILQRERALLPVAEVHAVPGRQPVDNQPGSTMPQTPPSLQPRAADLQHLKELLLQRHRVE